VKKKNSDRTEKGENERLTSSQEQNKEEEDAVAFLSGS